MPIQDNQHTEATGQNTNGLRIFGNLTKKNNTSIITGNVGDFESVIFMNF